MDEGRFDTGLNKPKTKEGFGALVTAATNFEDLSAVREEIHDHYEGKPAGGATLEDFARDMRMIGKRLVEISRQRMEKAETVEDISEIRRQAIVSFGNDAGLLGREGLLSGSGTSLTDWAELHTSRIEEKNKSQ